MYGQVNEQTTIQNKQVVQNYTERYKSTWKERQMIQRQ